MLVITDRMDAAMADVGFIRKKARWRRHSPELPIVVYQEQAQTGGPQYGFTVLFGFPHRDPEEWGCFQLSQGLARGRRDHYYDVAASGGREQIEQDFLTFTAPLAGRFHTGQELAAALIQGEIPPSSRSRGQTGVVKDVLDIAEAHGLPEARAYALDLARTLDASPNTRAQIRELAGFRPQVAEALDWTSVLPPRRRWWRPWS
jgi:hypothetical protein